MSDLKGNREIHEMVTNAIVTKVQNPNDWMITVRRFVEALNLNPAHCIKMGCTLETVVFEVLEHARAQGRMVAHVLAALEATV